MLTPAVSHADRNLPRVFLCTECLRSAPLSGSLTDEVGSNPTRTAPIRIDIGPLERVPSQAHFELRNKLEIVLEKVSQVHRTTVSHTRERHVHQNDANSPKLSPTSSRCFVVTNRANKANVLCGVQQVALRIDGPPDPRGRDSESTAMDPNREPMLGLGIVAQRVGAHPNSKPPGRDEVLAANR